MISRRNRKPVYAGAVVTVVTTGVFLALPYILPVDEIRTLIWQWTGEYPMGNPFTVLVMFGGATGGVIAGYLTGRKWDANMTNGIYAAVIGLVALYVLYVLVNIVYWTGLLGQYPPPIYNILIFPLIYFLPLSATHFLGGMAGGVAGGWIASFSSGDRTSTDPE